MKATRKEYKGIWYRVFRNHSANGAWAVIVDLEKLPSEIDWPTEEQVSEWIGRPVKFASGSEDMREALYQPAEPRDITPWVRWTDRKPDRPGYYWIALWVEGYDDPGDPELIELSESKLTDRGVVSWFGNYDLRELIWCGPLQPEKPPKFEK